MPDGVWQYKASWRSKMGSITLFLLFFMGLFLLLAADSGKYAGFGGAAAVCAWLAWIIGRPLFTGDWVLRIGPRGISGHILKNRTIPWRDVRDAGVETLQGNPLVVLSIAPEATESLAKTRRWLSGRKPERRIPLGHLRKQDIPQAISALHETFAARATAHAAAAVEARQEEARFEEAFEQQLTQHTKTTWALYAIVAVNVIAWLWNVATGISAMRPASADLFHAGAISAWAVTREHEFWRLLTGTFLHGGLMHLAMNMLGLWGAGKLLNRLYGNAQFLQVYLFSALVGASASLHFGAQTAVSVGASGAVFGVLGALVVAVRRHREQVPKALARQILTSETVFLVYALLNGFTRQGIDNAAHVGGLLAGAAMGWMLAGVVGDVYPGMRRLRAAAVGVGGMAVVAAMVATTPAPPVDHGSMFAASEQIQRVMPRIQAAQAALQKDVQQAQAGRMSADQLAQVVDTVHLPALRTAQADLAKIPRAQGDPRLELTADMQELTTKTIEGLEIMVRAQRGQARDGDQAREAQLKADLQVIGRRLQERLAALKPKQASSR